jgi:hypothetical protein
MDLKPALKKLEDSDYYKTWRKENSHTYFSYAFKIPQEMGDNEWQLGFYNPKKDKITTFEIADESIKLRQEEEIFKKEESKVNPIDLGKVDLTFDQALDLANKFQKEKYTKDNGMKTIAILQNMGDFGNVWNMTFVTETFKTLNMKLDASTGEIVSHKIESIFSVRQG